MKNALDTIKKISKISTLVALSFFNI